MTPIANAVLLQQRQIALKLTVIGLVYSLFVTITGPEVP
jgi:hypothetical protein